MNSQTTSRRLLSAEVIQTSAMDCGPAALKCLLESFGTPVSYGRLREACQTDVDGTSIDTLEEIAMQLGLDAEQVMLPVDHLLLPESQALPAMVVVRQPSGLTHVVVVWRKHGPIVQLMDPATGRRWVSGHQFIRDVYSHELKISANEWYEWAKTPDFLIPLNRRFKDLGLAHLSSELIKEATQNTEWIGLATLDAALRMTGSLVRNEAIKSGREAGKLLKVILRRAAGAPGNEQNIIPARYWSVRPSPLADTEMTLPQQQELWLKGAILIRVRGYRSIESGSAQNKSSTEDSTASLLLHEALKELPSRPLHELFRLMRGYGTLSWLKLAMGLMITALTIIFEIFLLRSALEIGYSINLIPQRLLAVGCFFAYILLVVFFELKVASALYHLGRKLEINLRAAMFSMIPALADQYFRSRPVSDMAERAHNSHQLRMLPRLGGQFARASLALLITGLALIWLYPQGMLVILFAIVFGLLVPLVFTPHLQELDLRVRTHTGALTRFYLDSMHGLTAVRAHSAQQAMMREQELLLGEWYRSSHQRVRSNFLLDGCQAASGFGFAVYLVFSYVNRVGDPAGAILLAYLALYVPVLGEEIALLVRQYPLHRNLTLRLLELLNAPVDSSPEPTRSPLNEKTKEPKENGLTMVERKQVLQVRACARGTAIILDSVTVRTGGHVILDNLDLRIDSGEHVAIIGASGTGKSSLAGLFLGWHQAASGQLLIDGLSINRDRLEQFRQETVWIDPSVQLWNRKFIANLTYGAAQVSPASLMKTLDEVELLDLLERLPDGLQTGLGEGGGLISGGEGQRVRIARGFLRPYPRFVVLDEAFRGLERNRRESLLILARKRWRHATLLCITHDIDQTRDFDRVLVLKEGRIVENGPPATLAGSSLSHFRAILDADTEVRNELWDEKRWLHLHLHRGQLHKAPVTHAHD